MRPSRNNFRGRKVRAQASMEFLMTYGWAILVVLAAIAALAYFGVLSPDKFLPEKCTMSPGLDCAEFKITATTIDLALRNGMGKHINISQIEVDFGTSTCTWNPSSDEVRLNNGDMYIFHSTGKEVSPCSNGIVGDRYKGDIKVTYADATIGIVKTMEGSVVGKILE